VTEAATRSECTTAELLSVMSSRILENGKVLFAGVGIPLLAATLAQRRHAPDLTILFEGGVVGPFIEPGRLPPSTNESRTARKANMVPSPTDVLALLQRGYVDYGFMGGAQVDQYGNLNSSFIGDPAHPKVRLPGSGGGNDIASLAKMIVAMPHEKKRFVAKVDFVTSPGYLDGGSTRRDSGLITGSMHKVITDLCIFGFDDATRQMKLEALHTGVKVEDVFENTGFTPIVPDRVEVTDPPTEEELAILNELDPDRMYLH
jgi:glutaconate CoA-transferase subunit B